MKFTLLLIIVSTLFLSCKRELKNQTKVKIDNSVSSISKLDRLKNDGLIITDTVMDFFQNGNMEKEFLAKFKLGDLDLFILSNYQFDSNFELSDFVLYDVTNERTLIIPQLTAVTYDLINIKPYPEFILKSYLPDSDFNFRNLPFFKQSLMIENNTVVFKNKLIYTPPKIEKLVLDSLIMKFDNAQDIDEITRDTIGVIDEMYFIKIFIGSISGNKDCERILYNLTDKFKVDGAIAESYSDFVYLDKLFKNNE